MSMRNKKAGRSWQKQAAGYPFRDTAVQKANDQYWKNCTTIRTVNFTHRARRGRDHARYKHGEGKAQPAGAGGYGRPYQGRMAGLAAPRDRRQ